ncbi:MAG: hypothetical protein O3C21_15050, partial [Verrucomicrobia bacterium]|nr:hypothetical protein [Verrucomicrobiota bacterium]
IRAGVFDIPLVPPIMAFVDGFDGPELEEGWMVRDDSPEAQIGFADGAYEVREPSTSENGDAGIRRSLVGMGGSFTADLMMTFDQFIGSNTDFKFRFFGGQFIEIVYNSFDDIRVFSAEKGENVNRIEDIGVTDGTPLHFRFIWDESGGDATVGLAIGDNPMMEIAVVEDLQNFSPDTVDFVMFKFGEGNGNFPGMLLDHFEIRPGVFSIPPIVMPVDAFADTFDGPELEEGWMVRDASPEAQIGFTENGEYQVNEPSTSADGDAGIRRAITGGGGSFTADLEMSLVDFVGSNTDFKFRFFGGQFIELVFNSFDDVRVFSAEQGGNVNRIDDIGVTDGAPLHFRFIWDATTGNATFGLSIDGGDFLEIATAEGLQDFTPNIVDFVMFKFGEGNGNTPMMLIDRFEIRDGVFPLNDGGAGPVIQITGFEFTSDAPLTTTITWTSAPDETYTVQSSEDLITWGEVGDGIVSGGTMTSLEVILLDPAPAELYFRALREN